MFNGQLPSIDVLESALLAHQAELGRCQAAILALLHALDVGQVAAVDGSRTFEEWVAGRLDVAPETAKTLVEGARRLIDHPDLCDELGAGETTIDRALATARLADAGADGSTLDASRGYDIAGVRRLAARHRRHSRADERSAFRDRFFAMQPSLDELSWDVWGKVVGMDGRILEQALIQKSDEFPNPPEGVRPGRGARMADALVAIAQDSLEGPPAAAGATAQVSVFVDLDAASSTRGEAGAEIENGPRIGPRVLDEILCGGTVQIMGLLHDAPLAATPRTSTIPPRVRRFVAWRDGGCTIDGCHSRYRLQPHHIRRRADGGSDDPDNLATLCWYHHHVVVHGYGYRIDPDSPPLRRRFLRPVTERGPP